MLCFGVILLPDVKIHIFTYLFQGSHFCQHFNVHKVSVCCMDGCYSFYFVKVFVFFLTITVVPVPTSNIWLVCLGIYVVVVFLLAPGLFHMPCCCAQFSWRLSFRQEAVLTKAVDSEVCGLSLVMSTMSTVSGCQRRSAVVRPPGLHLTHRPSSLS